MDDVLLLGPESAALRAGTRCRHVRPQEVRAALERGGRRPTCWVAGHGTSLKPLVEFADDMRGDHRLVLLDAVNEGREAVLRARFRSVIVGDEASLLPFDELLCALTSPERDRLFIGGTVDLDDGVVLLHRADLSLPPLLVPTAWFTPSGDGTAPDFARFAVVDYGTSVQLGEYEASATAILYEFDADFRRQARRDLAESDASFGAALRRLRLQKGLSRADFPGISPKQIARIERGETDQPRQATLARIAERLGVAPEDIASY
ncbi:MAG TPA: helix-turn-helix transcriptional regulator [Longimicrobium sp.]|uniref:helix-turn-helix transcriptional regulator n=1 Tax=Longimicrobium sp. TaxID=2029185 RepID=UPI002EDBA2DC